MPHSLILVLVLLLNFAKRQRLAMTRPASLFLWRQQLLLLLFLDVSVHLPERDVVGPLMKGARLQVTTLFLFDLLQCRKVRFVPSHLMLQF